MVQRGQEGTTAKFWPAGTFIRQIPDPVSVAPGGIISIESEASVSIVGAAAGIDGRTGQDRIRYEQVETPDVTLTTTSREITAEIQPELNVESVSTITEESTTIYEVGANVVSSFNVEHKETYIRIDVVLDTIPFQFDVSETIVNVAVNPTVTSLSQITSDTEIISTTSFVRIATITDSVSYNETVIRSELQSIQSQFVVRKEALEVVLIPPPSGVIDGYEEDVFISDPIGTRLNGFVNISDDYGVVKRDGTVIFVSNSVFGTGSQYIGTYTTTNAGHTISHFEGIFDDGTCNVSGISIQELDTYYPALTLRDFTTRGDSSYTISNAKFILMPPSIQNPVAISSSSGTIGGPIVVQDTTYFPDEGYLFTSGGTVIQYTSKTTTTFEGCTLYSGPDSISNGDELVPFSIS